MELEAKLTLDTGPFAAALADALAAVEKLAGETGGLSARVAEARERLSGMGEAAQSAAKSVEELTSAQRAGAKFVAEAAARSREAGDGAEESAAKFNAASAGMAGLSAASAAASGNAAGAARGIVQLRSSVAAAGASAGAAAGPLLAIAAAAAAAAVAFRAYQERVRELGQMRLDNIFENARNAAKGLTGEIARTNRELERQNNLKRALAGVADDGRRAAQEAELAKLEWERQNALRNSGFDEEDAQINRDFDLRRAEMEWRHAGENSRAAMDADRAKRDENNAGIAAREGQIKDLTSQVAEAVGKALGAGQKGDADEAKRWNDVAAGLNAAAARLRDEIAAMQGENEVLTAKLDNWGDSYGLNAAGWRLEAERSKLEADEARGRREIWEPESPGGAGAGESRSTFPVPRSPAILSDSLARIGGFVGVSAQDRAAERAQRERENQTRLMEQIERNTREGGSAVLG